MTETNESLKDSLFILEKHIQILKLYLQLKDMYNLLMVIIDICLDMNYIHLFHLIYLYME